MQVDARVPLAPGETRTVGCRLPASSLAWWDATADRWVVEAGTVHLDVGASSADVRATRTIRVIGSR